MGTAAEFLGGAGFGFDAPETVERLRAGSVPDRYSGGVVRQDWSNPDVLVLHGASISSGGQTQADGSQRRLVVGSAVLTVTDPAADVQVGDRIRRGVEVWACVDVPTTDINPFTGWRPTLVITLEAVRG